MVARPVRYGPVRQKTNFYQVRSAGVLACLLAGAGLLAYLAKEGVLASDHSWRADHSVGTPFLMQR